MADPVYRQIAEDLRQRIEAGELSHGEQLPTELELRVRYEASRNTVRDAVKLLITRGLVETYPGRGTFVAEQIEPFITVIDLETGFGSEGGAAEPRGDSRDRRTTTGAPRIEIHHAAGVAGRELGLEEGATVVSRHVQRFIDGTPWSIQVSYYPISLVERGAVNLIRLTDMPFGVVRYLEEVLAIKQVGWRDKITVRAPDLNETAFFKLPGDGRVAVFEIFETGFDESGTPFRLTVTTYPADRNQFVMNVGPMSSG
jgi:GntR family transcriptional regulator